MDQHQRHLRSRRNKGYDISILVNPLLTFLTDIVVLILSLLVHFVLFVIKANGNQHRNTIRKQRIWQSGGIINVWYIYIYTLVLSFWLAVNLHSGDSQRLLYEAYDEDFGFPKKIKSVWSNAFFWFHQKSVCV